MRRTATATLLIAVFLSLSAFLNGCGENTEKTETVSAATISELPPGKTFEVDLTKKGTVYRFNDAGTDFSRVTIRTTAGVKNFGELLKAASTNVGRGVVLGTPDDMRNHLPPGAGSGGTTNYDCGIQCKCDGTTDCMALILAGKCAEDLWCSDTGACYCTPKP